MKAKEPSRLQYMLQSVSLHLYSDIVNFHSQDITQICPALQRAILPYGNILNTQAPEMATTGAICNGAILFTK